MESLQAQLEKAQMDLLAEKANGQQKDQDKINELEALEASLLKQIMDEQNQQVLEQRVEEDVRDNGYIFDTLKTSDGLTMPEIILDDVQYDYVRRTVQVLVVGMNTSHSNLITALKSEQWAELQSLTERVTEAEGKAEELQSGNKDLELKNYELGLINDELDIKCRKGAEMLHEATEQIKQQKQHIEDLRTQQTLGIRQALNVVSEPQDTTSFKAEIDARKPRITNVRFKDENGIDTRIKKADNVLTGEPVEYEAIYEKRYIILNEVEAGQYRADEANKKAEAEQLQAAIPTLEVPEIQPVNPVSEVEAPAEEKPFPEAEVQSTESTVVEGPPISDREVAPEESEIAYVTQKEYQTNMAKVFDKIDQLTIRVYDLELDKQAVA